jgi:hypothetical protein
MKRKNLMLTVAAAAVLGAFNPALAGGGKDYSAGADANVGADASIGADTKSSTDMSSSGAGSSSGTGTQAGAEAQGSASIEDKKTGLDRADQVAGEARPARARQRAREAGPELRHFLLRKAGCGPLFFACDNYAWPRNVLRPSGGRARRSPAQGASRPRRRA